MADSSFVIYSNSVSFKFKNGVTVYIDWAGTVWAYLGALVYDFVTHDFWENQKSLTLFKSMNSEEIAKFLWEISA